MMQVFISEEYTINNLHNYRGNDLYYVTKLAPKKVRDNQLFIEKVVQAYSFCFRWASPRLRNKPEVIELALSRNPHNLAYLDDEYRSNYDFVKPIIIKNATTIQYVLPPIQDRPELIDIVLTDHLSYFRHLSKKTRNNRELVLSIVSRDTYGDVVSSVSNRLKDDEDVILAAAKTSANEAYTHASRRLKMSKSFALSYLCNTNYNFNVLTNFHDDFDVALMAMGKDSNWAFVHENLKLNKEFCKQMVLYHGQYLSFLYPEFKADKEVVLSAVINDFSAIFNAAPEIQDLVEPFGFKNSQEILKWQIECDLRAPFSMNIIAFGRTKEFIARVHFCFI